MKQSLLRDSSHRRKLRTIYQEFSPLKFKKTMKDIKKLMNFNNPFQKTSSFLSENKKLPMNFEDVYQENIRLRAAFDKLSEDYYQSFRQHQFANLNKRIYKSEYETEDTETKSQIRRSAKKQKSVEIQTIIEEPKEPAQSPVTVINNLANPMESALHSLGRILQFEFLI
jgi:hypothetical protein